MKININKSTLNNLIQEQLGIKYVQIVYNEGHDVYTDYKFTASGLEQAKNKCKFLAQELNKLMPLGTWSVGLCDYQKYVKKGDDNPFFTAR